MFAVAFALLGAAGTFALLCPRMLSTGRWQLLHPRAALTIWFGSFGLGCAVALSGIALGVVAIESVQHAIPHSIGLIAAEATWVAVGILGLVVAGVVLAAGSVQSIHSEAHPQAIAYARDEHVGFTLVRFHSTIPEAYAVPGRRPEIFISSAMELLLSGPQLHAVLAHEFAHLRHRHSLAIRIAQLNAVLLPGMRVGLALERSTRLQVELAADDAAARQVGAAHLANALTTIAAATQNSSMVLRAERLREKRWPVATNRRVPRGLRASYQLT